MPALPNPIRYAELRTAKEWGIPINEWDRLSPDDKMEMMAHIDAEDKYQSYIKFQRDAHRKSKTKKAGLSLKRGRSG